MKDPADPHHDADPHRDTDGPWSPEDGEPPLIEDGFHLLSVKGVLRSAAQPALRRRMREAIEANQELGE